MKTTSSALFYISAALYNIAALITFISGGNNSMGIIWLCLGSTFLCLGAAKSKKTAASDEESSEK